MLAAALAAAGGGEAAAQPGPRLAGGALFSQPDRSHAWGVELASVQAPVALWHGEQGGLVPTAHARWLADAIPAAEVRLFADEGALPLIFRHASEIIGWLGTQLHSGR